MVICATVRDVPYGWVHHLGLILQLGFSQEQAEELKAGKVPQGWADFFDTATHPQAVFEGPIQRAADGHEVAGTLTLRGVKVPVTLPFTLTVTGDTATASGGLGLDRRDFGMGASYTDESSVGFAVQVAFELTATRP